MIWNPLLTDVAEIKEIETVIYKIANGLGRTGNNSFTHSSDVSLMYGKFGSALFYAYLYRYSADKAHYETFDSLLDESFQLMSGMDAQLSFGRGHAGFAWCLQHLALSGFLDADIDEMVTDVSDKLYALTDYFLEKGDYDYLLGGLGPAVYLLERAKAGNIDLFLKKVVTHLEALAFCDDGGDYFWEQVLHDAPPRINLGIAHGIPGLLVILSKCYRLGIEPEICSRLIDGGYAFLMKSKMKDAPSCYAFSIQDGHFEGSTPLRWCYGDLGISIAFLTVGQNMGRSEWQEEGIRLGLSCAARLQKELPTLADAHFCHGSAGVGHVLTRLYHHTGLDAFRDGALFCLKDTLRRVVSIDDYITFVADKGDFGKLHIDGLMEGSTGIALCLLALIDKNEPAWDSCFLLS